MKVAVLYVDGQVACVGPSMHALVDAAYPDPGYVSSEYGFAFHDPTRWSHRTVLVDWLQHGYGVRKPGGQTVALLGRWVDA